jgi:hypothetical protein
MAGRNSTAAKCLVKVGNGRGFVVEEQPGLCLYPKRFIITAAHCLPLDTLEPDAFLDPAPPTFPDLLGKLDGDASVWAKCLFIDQIGDIAVLSAPDNADLYDQIMAYEELVEAAMPRSIGAAVPWNAPTPVSLIALNGSPILGSAEPYSNLLRVEKTSQPIVPGMSGSPVLDQNGAAIGIVTLTWNDRKLGTTDAASARLLAHLPGWLLVSLGAGPALATETEFARNYFLAKIMKVMTTAPAPKG